MRGNPLPPHGLLFLNSYKGSFICTIPHTTAFVTPVMDHWLEQEIAHGSTMKDRYDDPSHYVNWQGSNWPLISCRRNDALNTFYLWLGGIGHIVKKLSDSEKRNLLPSLHELFFLINSKSSFICTIRHTG